MTDEVSEFLEDRKLSGGVAQTFGLQVARKRGRTGLRYATDCGVDRIKFLDGDNPKVVWFRRGGVTHFYNLERARDLPGDIWIVNGEPSVWACQDEGIPAICTCGGEGSIPDVYWIRELAKLGRRVHIAFDHDSAGMRGSVQLAQALLEYDIDVTVRRWKEFLDFSGITDDQPVEELKGFDVDDLHQLVGADLLVCLNDLEILPVERADKPEPLRHSHWELATCVLRRLDTKDGPGIVYSSGAFWRYSLARGVWLEVDEKAFEREIGSLDGHVILDGEKAKMLSVSFGMIESVKKCAAAQAYQAQYFDDAPRGVQFENGFLNADTMKLEPSSPELKQQLALGFDYAPTAECPLWLDAVAALFWGQPDARQCIDLLQETAGAVLFGITGRVLFLTGEGNNGKSTVLDVFTSLVPPEVFCSIAPHKLSSGHQSEYWVAQLAGKRLNVDADIPGGEMIESSEFKKAVTGDPLTGRDPAGKPFTFRPRIVNVFSANELPGTRDHSHGFWRRIIALPFDRNFTEDPNTGVSDRLRAFRANCGPNEFGQKLFEREAQGIVSWAIRGALRLLAAEGPGFTKPASSVELVEDWKRRADQVATFMAQNYRADVEIWTSAVDVFDDYCKWAARTKHGTMSETTFGNRMRKLGFSKKRGTKRRVASGNEYKIARLQAVAPDDDPDIPF